MVPEIALAKIRDDAPFDKVCYIGCGVTTGIGAVINTAKVRVGDRVVVFGLGGIGLNVVQGARIAGASMIVGIDLNPGRRAMAEKFGMTHFVNPAEVRGELVPYIADLTKGGADYAFECVGNVKLDAAGAGMLPARMGHLRDNRRGGGRAGDCDAAVSARDRTDVEGHSVRWSARAARRAEDRRLVYGQENQYRRFDYPHNAARANQ